MEDIVSLQLTDGWTVDVRNREAHKDDTVVALTERESELLCYLAARAGEFVGKEALLRDVWGYRATTETRAISNCIRRLRKKLGDSPRNARILESKYGGSLRLVGGSIQRASPVSTVHTHDIGRESGVLPVWWPAGSDRPDRWLIQLCGRMEDIAVAMHHTHLGVEHLIDALARERGASGPASLWASTQLPGHRARFAVPELSPVDLPDAALAFTPRMLRAVRGPGYTIDGERMLVRLLTHGGLAATLGLKTLPGGEKVQTGGAIMGLEVVGGPEDGLRLQPQPEQTIGRAAPEEGPDVGLYTDTALVDRRLSRQHLVWLGGGTVELKRRGVLESAKGMGERSLAPGRWSLDAGDRLRLGAGTWLRTLTAAEIRES